MTALLGSDEPNPVSVSREHGKSPFFLTADHAGKLIPCKLGDLGVAAADLERHIAWDIGIAGVTERLSAALDATAVLQTYFTRCWKHISNPSGSFTVNCLIP